MSCNSLNDSDHVVRYVRPTLLGQNGVADSRAFQHRGDEKYLSANWLEYVDGKTTKERLKKIKVHCGLKMSPKGKIVELNVGQTIKEFAHYNEKVYFRHKPNKSNVSHTAIFLSKSYRSMSQFLLDSLWSRCIKCTHPVPS